MSTTTSPRPATIEDSGSRIATAGQWILRYGLVVVVAWIGALKFTHYEAAGIQPLVAHSPFLGWLYGTFSVQGFSDALGTVEIIAAVLIATRPWWPRISAAGSALTMLLFVGTLTFLFTTPGITEATAGGFPALSVLPGQFLLKDIVLLGAAVWSLGEALAHSGTKVAR
jgi:uncharacterized membrane protein YkgB